MDLDDFWQENKRWVLGCLAGLLIFVIAYNVFADGPKKGSKAGSMKDVYKSAQLTSIRKDKTSLDQTLADLRKAMHYEVPPEFIREGQPGLFWATTYISLRTNLIDLAEAENVQFPEDSFAWQPDTGAAAIDRALVGCSLVQFAVTALLDAHRSVTAADFDAPGLRDIGKFEANRARGPRRNRRRADDPIEAEELIEEVKVRFLFRADHTTLHRFLENCRTGKRRVTLGTLKVVRGKTSGDPLTVSGEIVALTIKPIPKDI